MPIVGILDIFGFEIFDTNSFEQLCINYTNEHLQAHFNQHMCQLEQELYQREEIEWSFLPFPDNSMVIRLFEHPSQGLFGLLDEACAMQKSTAQGLLTKYKGRLSENGRFYIPKKRKKLDFGVKHFAGDVVYNASEFLPKNKNSLNSQFQEVMRTSSNCVLRKVFNKDSWGQVSSSVSLSADPLPSKTNKPSKMIQSVSRRFVNQLFGLMQVLNQSLSMYVRCIKPNSVKSSSELDSRNVNRQLHCAGMLDALKIRKAGFPIRKSYIDFYTKYWKLFQEKVSGKLDLEKCKLSVINFLKENQNKIGYDMQSLQTGNSKLFLKTEILDRIEIMYVHKMQGAVIFIQKVWRAKLVRVKKELLRTLARSILKRVKIKHFFRTNAMAIRKRKLEGLCRTVEIAQANFVRRNNQVLFTYMEKKYFEYLENLKRKKEDSENSSVSLTQDSNWQDSITNSFAYEKEETIKEQEELVEQLEHLLTKKVSEIRDRDRLLQEKDNQIEEMKAQIEQLNQKLSDQNSKMNVQSNLSSNSKRPNAFKVEPLDFNKLNNRTQSNQFILNDSKTINTELLEIPFASKNELDLHSTIQILTSQKEMQGEIFSTLLTILKLKTLENKLVYKSVLTPDMKIKKIIHENLLKLKGDEKTLKHKLTQKLEELNSMDNENFIERFSYLRGSFMSFTPGGSSRSQLFKQ